MNKEKASILDVIGAALAALFFGGMCLAALSSGGWIGAIFLALLTVACITILVADLRRGVRPPTRYEGFRLWMIARPVLAVGIGIGVLIALLGTSTPMLLGGNTVAGALIAGGALLWAALVFYLLWRAPHRHETDAAYKRRVGYRDKN
jgi:hypothetical protein